MVFRVYTNGEEPSDHAEDLAADLCERTEQRAKDGSTHHSEVVSSDRQARVIYERFRKEAHHQTEQQQGSVAVCSRAWLLLLRAARNERTNVILHVNFCGLVRIPSLRYDLQFTFIST